jgi:hypothetical protein
MGIFASKENMPHISPGGGVRNSYKQSSILRGLFVHVTGKEAQRLSLCIGMHSCGLHILKNVGLTM